MKYQAIQISQRTLQVKRIYSGLTVPQMTDPYHPTKYKPFGTGDRLITLGYLRGYEKHASAETVRLRASYAEAEELYQAKPMIYDAELLLGHLYLPDYTEEEQVEYDRLCEKFSMSAQTRMERPPRKDHIGLDLEKLLRVGIRGICEEIRAKMEAIDFAAEDSYPNLEAAKRWEFYNCCLIELDAVSDLAARYAAEALRLAEEAQEPRKSELLCLGAMLKKVPDAPAESFHEALQSVHFFLSTLFGLYPLGRPDRYLYPYYEKDIASGALTKEHAQELIDQLCLGISDRVFTRAACGFIVGGKDASGALVENDLTYMFLTALDHLHLPDPNGALAVCPETSDAILSYAAEILSHGTTHPAFYNDVAITKSLIEHYGVSPEDAADYIHSTCAEISVIGKSKSHTTPFMVDLPRHLCEIAKTREYTDFDSVFDAYLAQVKSKIQLRAKNYAIRIMEAARIGNEPMRICTLIDNCIERGKGIYEGGEKYTFVQPIFVGFATAVDSLVAIQTLVYEKGEISLSEFSEIVESNFEENETLRRHIVNKVSHYGNDSEETDAMAARLASALQAIFDSSVALKKQMMPGTFSYINHAQLGAKMGATFDGRLAGNSYSDGCGPVQGRDVNGATAMIRSLTSWDQSRLLGGMVVNMKFGKANLSGEKAKNFVALLRVFMERGGMELQVNVVDRKILLNAEENPEAYRDILVRVGGYSDYFTRLSPALRKEIIERTEY